jgi:ATP-binding cassette subfamily F protein 3
MLYFDKLSLRRGSKLLFADASFTIGNRHKVGITGANGTGKSSLFALIKGEIEEDGGSFRLESGSVIAHVAQETPALDMPAIDYVMQGDGELWTLQQEIEKAEAEHAGERLIRLHERMMAIDGYAGRARAARLMHGLGFKPGEEERAVASFSGGWRMRLNLAQALMCRSDLLLLDEPTNHLDLEAVIWLERWLNSYGGALLLISHDRDFLDRCVNHIAHVEQQKITLYSGNYTAFERIRAEKLALQQAAHEKQQRQVAHMTAFIDRFRAKATKARQAQSRIKALERMQLIAPAHVDSPFSFHFSHPGQVPNPLLRLNRVDAGYGDAPILRKLVMSLLPGERIGLLGPNGAGKSTLIKLLAGELVPLAGERIESQGLRIGYFAQHQLEQLHEAMSPLQHLMALDAGAGEKELRSFLGGFDFHGDMALAPVGPMSGGEKARLVLAMIVNQQPNLLLLDEPTNHLDLEMRHALSMALQDFEGVMVLVSHDRHLLRSVCDSLWLVAEGAATVFDGDLEDYARWLSEQGSDTSEVVSTPAVSRKDQRREQAERRKATQPLRNRVKRLEQQLEKLQARKEELTTRLADPALYEDGAGDQLQGLSREHREVEVELEAIESEWLEASEELESLSA